MESHELEQLIRSGMIGTTFAPVHDTYNGKLAGFIAEPISRDANRGDSDAIRSAIQESDVTGDLDASIRGIALRDAERAGLTAATRLFLAAEPESLVTLEERSGGLERSIVLKLDPASIRANPAAVMRSIRSARQMGWGIGIRNLGLELDTMAFIPLVNPSVLSLHPDVLRIEDTAYLARLIWLLQSHLERTGAVVMAKGVRDEHDADLAEQLGARLMCGPRVGDPVEDPTPVEDPSSDYLRDHFTRNKQVQGTPYSISKNLDRDPLISSQSLMVHEMQSLLERAVNAGKSAVVVTVLADDTSLNPKLEKALVQVAQNVGLTAAVAGGLERMPAPEIRTGPIDSSDPLLGEYAVIVVGADWSAMIAAHRLPSPGLEGREEFETFITTDRFACVDAARTVLSRLATKRS